jgi:hypothetical protein
MESSRLMLNAFERLCGRAQRLYEMPWRISLDELVLEWVDEE